MLNISLTRPLVFIDLETTGQNVQTDKIVEWDTLGNEVWSWLPNDPDYGFNLNDFDYITNSKPRTFPQGISVEVFSFKTLEIAWNNAKLPSEKEHVTPYMYNNPKNFKIHNYSSSNNLSHLRWTVDRKNDYELSKKIASNIQKLPIRMNDVLNLLKEKPELIDINSDHDMDEGYKKSLKEDQEFTI